MTYKACCARPLYASANYGEAFKQKAANMAISTKQLIQNLKDSGCGGETVKEYLNLEKEHNSNAQLKLLDRHRRLLLDQIHNEEKQIACLD